MGERLNDAAQAGDIDTMYKLLSLDPFLFENIDGFPFVQTPLHFAALAGQTSFVMELLNLKPSFIRKLNTEGYSPVHLACLEGHIKMVREILEFDHELGLIKGREWRTPLHCAVINGRVDVVGELLLACSPDCLRALTVRKETVLHLALKYDQIEVFEVLVKRFRAENGEEIVNWEDNEGNTILHLATYRKQFQIIELLLKSNDFCEVVDIDMTNTSGLTALDVLRQHSINEHNNVEIENLLQRVGAAGAHDTVISITTPLSRTTSNSSIEPMIVLEELFQGLPMEKWAKEIENSPSETRSTLMVVAVLIATVTFQVVLSPPGGFSENGNNGLISSALSKGYLAFLILLSIMNSIGFMTSIAMITVLTRRSPLKAPMRIAVLSMVATYLCSITYIDSGSPVIVTVVALLMLTLLLLQWINLKLRSLIKKLL
ncbi:hypothetical protein IFM89_032446 [Coptis chinensis]|uniref:PGG domain-containing protein n=1 Tax=Coptis chinensis TaxID=261450 RepID=A0A835I575_9MAGN|nr:hypothetical protein IFM89_032446 [Coptis chinensis]